MNSFVRETRHVTTESLRQAFTGSKIRGLAYDDLKPLSTNPLSALKIQGLEFWQPRLQVNSMQLILLLNRKIAEARAYS